MELQQLKALVAIEREGTISAAAKALHTSQPSVSRLVKGLEADLGQELFDRTRNRACLNEAGELALAARPLDPRRRVGEGAAVLV